ncbi:MAG TPA: EAL domain-containing protein [Ilumatobacteraceae bacterium]|nr:EAL domain-containing protein [Ilumatobacteraceae bacterium]
MERHQLVGHLVVRYVVVGHLVERHELDGHQLELIRRPSPVVRTCLFSGTLFAVAAVAYAMLPDRDDSLLPASWWVLPALGVLFAISEIAVFHFEFRREAISFSLSEVPTAFALLFLTPGPAVVARAVAAVVVLAVIRRSKWFKVLFNSALFTVETVLSFHIMHAITGGESASTVRTALAIVPATAIATVTGSVLVSLIIAMMEGDLARRLRAELRISAWMAPTNAAVAATIATPTLIDARLTVVSAAPLIAFWGVTQGYGHLLGRFRDLSDLHGFVGRVGGSLDIDDVIGAAALEVATLLRAARVGVVVFDREGHQRRADVGEPLPGLPTSADAPDWAELAGRGAATALDPQVHLGLVELATLGDVVVAPVTDEESVLGMIAVAQREGVHQRFRNDDLTRLATIAEQFAPSVRKALLHERIDYEARHDPLTELPNRATFERLVNAELQNVRIADDEWPVLMLMDLDRFKEVNDTLGHHAGDRVLAEFAQRVVQVLRPTDLVARLAGDEFALLALRRNEEITVLAEQLMNVARKPFTIDGLEVVVTMSIGVAPATLPTADANVLLRRADIAMYAAKNRHTGYEMYREEIDRRTPARLAMLGDLRNALDAGQLQVYLQPKLDLGTGWVIGVEALARWSHNTRGWVSPEDFVPVAEETGLIKQVTDHVLEVSVSHLRRLRAAGHHLGLAVNLSTHDLLDELLADRVMHQLERHDVDPALLTLEITESSLLIDAPRARQTIERLNRQGIRLSVDDFGTGYSSLSYLRHLPVSELKIDRSFITQLLFDEQDEVIVRSIIELGHNLGMQVVAEGVETDEVLSLLRTFSCDLAQGYGICRPVPLDQFMNWLGTTHHPSRRSDPMRPEQWPGERPL